MVADDSQDEWTVVRRGGRRAFRSAVNCLKIDHTCTAKPGVSRNPTSLNELTARMDRLRGRMERKYLQVVCSMLERVLAGHPLELVRAFGIGSIEPGQDGAYQFILLEAIKDHFRVPLVTSQDPVTTRAEREYMQSRGVSVFPADDLLAAPPVDLSSSNSFTLLYMLHCTSTMYNNVLSHYIEKQQQLHRLILIGNDPRTVYESRSDKPLPNLAPFARQCMRVPMPHFEARENAFTTTFISFLDEEDEEE